MASTTKGFAKKVAIAATATAVDPIDLLGNAVTYAQGIWVLNASTGMVTIARDGVTSTTGADDSVPVPPNSWVWFTKPGHSKANPPTLLAGQGWSAIAGTAGDIYLVSDNGSWHPLQ